MRKNFLVKRKNFRVFPAYVLPTVDFLFSLLYNIDGTESAEGEIMKVKTIRKPIEEALAIPPPKRKKLKKPSFLFQTLVRILSVTDLIATKFSYTKSRMKEAGKGPYLILMNHSSFIDLKIASKVF